MTSGGRISMYIEPMQIARQAIETMMRKFCAEELPPKGRFHYHQGVFLSGVWNCGVLMNENRYLDYVKAWVDARIDAQGRISEYDPGQMDDIQPGILLFPLYERTGDKKYKLALDTLAPAVTAMPKNPDGGNWHKAWCERQMWLDGLYMGGPILAEYGRKFDEPEYYDFVIKQVNLMRAHTRDPKTGLWYHAYDDARAQVWADKRTGCSPEFWGRSVGWVAVALQDDLEFIPKTHPKHSELVNIETDLLKSVAGYQSEEGRWYQVIDKGGYSGNWLENSCSCLFAAAFARAVLRGYLPMEYGRIARKAYNAVCASLDHDGENLLVNNVCIGTGVGDYDFYIARPTSVNDLHGVGAFLLMCAEIEKFSAFARLQETAF